MEKKDFPKGTKPREIFVYTCERIAEPLIPLGYKYRKSKNDIYKKDGMMTSPAMRYLLCWSGNAPSRRFPGRSGTMPCRSSPGFPTCRSCWTMWNERGSSPIGGGSMSLSGIGSSSNASREYLKKI